MIPNITANTTEHTVSILILLLMKRIFLPGHEQIKQMSTDERFFFFSSSFLIKFIVHIEPWGY